MAVYRVAIKQIRLCAMFASHRSEWHTVFNRSVRTPQPLHFYWKPHDLCDWRKNYVFPWIFVIPSGDRGRYATKGYEILVWIV